jgi:hypothetical protein
MLYDTAAAQIHRMPTTATIVTYVDFAKDTCSCIYDANVVEPSEPADRMVRMIYCSTYDACDTDDDIFSELHRILAGKITLQRYRR